MPSKSAKRRAKSKQVKNATQKDDESNIKRDDVDRVVDKIDKLTLEDINEMLPAELIFKIFSFLSLRTLSKVVLVCQKWREVGEDPKLWTGMELAINNNIRSKIMGEIWDMNLSLMAILPQVLNARRFQFVKSLKLSFTDFYGYVMSGYSCSDDKFQAILEHPGLNKLHISMSADPEWPIGWKINDVDPNILAAAFKKMKKLSLVKPTGLDDEHLSILFDAINEETKLDYMRICEILTSIDATVLGTAVNKLEEVDFSSSQLTVQQINEIMKLAMKTDSKLKTLHLKYVEDVDRDMLEEANKKLDISFADSDEDETDDSETDEYDGLFFDDDSDEDFNFGRFQGGFYSHGDAMGFPRYSSDWHHFEDKYYYGSD